MLRLALCIAAVTSVLAVTRQNVGPVKVNGKDMLQLSKVQDASAQLKEGAQKKMLAGKYKFQHFVKDFKRMYVPGSDEWKLRETTFNKNLELLQMHHSGPAKAWSVGINKFMDYHDDEFNKLLGYKGSKKTKPMSLLQSHDDDISDIPAHHSWLSKMPKASKFYKDQGACGSCWAIAAATALEGHVEITHGDSTHLSSQFLVSCMPNLMECGGTGGCQGATAELAFQYIKENGIPSEHHWPYSSGSGSNGVCDPGRKSLKHVSIGAWKQLPENKGAPLLRALYEKGPVVVSADASTFSSYTGGIFAGCEKDAILNHAITAEGFGEEFIQTTNQVHKYYLIRNSWGKEWGEGGYIRLERFDDDAHYCGVDNKPEDGTACKGGPAFVNVAGMCGILYDSAYPEDVKFVTTEEGGTYAGFGKEHMNMMDTAGLLINKALKH